MADFEQVDFGKIVSELFQLVQSAENPTLVGAVGDLAHTDSAEAAFRKLVKGIKRVRAALPGDVDLADCGPQELSDMRQLIDRLDEFEAIYVGGNKGQTLPFPCDEQDVAIVRKSLKSIQRTRNLEWMDSEGIDALETPKQPKGKRKLTVNDRMIAKGKRGATGPIVSKKDSENRQLVADRWDEFRRDYKALGSSRATYHNAAKWMVDKTEDMEFLTEGLSDPSDYDKIGKVIKALVRAHRETPSPKRDS